MRRKLAADRPTVPEVRPLVAALYEQHSAGCCWHVVLDDGNVNDDHVKWCAKLATELGHPDCVALVGPLAAMSITQRRKLANE